MSEHGKAQLNHLTSGVPTLRSGETERRSIHFINLSRQAIDDLGKALEVTSRGWTRCLVVG
jgi:hypothetical protein